MYLLNNFFVGLVIVTTVPELCQKFDFFLKKRMKIIFAHVLKFIHVLTLAKMQNNKYFKVKTVRNLRLKHFESYSSFSYCTHSSVSGVLVQWLGR